MLDLIMIKNFILKNKVGLVIFLLIATVTTFLLANFFIKRSQDIRSRAASPSPTLPTQQGLWISPQEIASLPTSGPAWNRILDRAGRSEPHIISQSSKADVIIVAQALACARTGQNSWCQKTLDGIRAIMQARIEKNALDPAETIAGYVIAADIINLSGRDPSLDAAFRTWLHAIVRQDTDRFTLIECHETKPNNWSTLCGFPRIAAALYLNDSAELARSATVFKGWLGDRNTYAGFKWTNDLSWQCDSNNPVGINPKGCTKNGHNIDGVLPDDQRRCGSFSWPPCSGNYPWTGLQGAYGQAVLLHRAGYDVWNWSDQALLRAIEWLYTDHSTGGPLRSATGDDEWLIHLVNYYYKTNFPEATPSKIGKVMDWTDWTHQGQTSQGVSQLPEQPSAAIPNVEPTPPSIIEEQSSTQTQTSIQCALSFDLDTQATPPPAAQCVDVKAYTTEWQLLEASDLALLQPGDVVRLTVRGSTTSGVFDKARFTINGDRRAEVTGKRPQTEEFFDEYTVPEGVTSFSVDAEVHHQGLDTWF